MKEHEHAAKNKPETKPAHDEVAKKAYDIYEKEGRPQGRAEENWSEGEGKTPHAGSRQPAKHDHHDHHAHMTADFRKRFWISLVLTLPILVLAVPLVVAVCTALAASNGLLIRNRVAFEGARKLKAVIFDKTGTLTEGRFGVTETLVLGDDITEEMLRSYAASVDANSTHPIAKAIAAASDKKLPVEGFNSITGKGAEGRVDGKDIKVVSPGYLRDQNIVLTDNRIEPLQAQGKTVVFVLVESPARGPGPRGAACGRSAPWRREI